MDIKQSIEIIDKSTKPLKDIAQAVLNTHGNFNDFSKGLNNTGDNMSKLINQTKILKSNLDSNAFKTYSTFGNNAFFHNLLDPFANSDFKNPFSGIKNIFSDFKNNLPTMKETETSLKNILELATKVGLSFLAIKSSIGLVKKTLNMSDELTTMQIKLNNIGISFNELANFSRKARTDLSRGVEMLSDIKFSSGDLFSSNKELLDFTSILSQQFKLSGMNATEAEGAISQLARTLGTDKLQGRQFLYLQKNAPLFSRSLANYLNTSVGELRNLANQGLLTGDIVKNAILASSQEIEDAIAKMPKTFSGTMAGLKREIQIALQPVAEEINKMVNSEKFQNIFNAVKTSIVPAFKIAESAVMGVGDAISWVVENINGLFTILAPIGLIILGMSGPIGLITAGILGISSVLAGLRGDTEDTANKTGNSFSKIISFLINAAEIATNMIIWLCNQFISAFYYAKGVIFGILSPLLNMAGNVLSWVGQTEKGEALKNKAKKYEEIGNKSREDATNKNSEIYIKKVDFSGFKKNIVSALNGDKTTNNNNNNQVAFKKFSGFTKTGNPDDSGHETAKNTGKTAKGVGNIDKNVSSFEKNLQSIKDFMFGTMLDRTAPVVVNVQMTNNQSFPSNMNPTGVAQQTTEELMRIIGEELSQINAISTTRGGA